MGFSAGDGNLRRYVGNNPTNATDPDGLQSTRVYTPQRQEMVANVATIGPVRARRAYDLSRLALTTAKKRFPVLADLHNNEGDAWRHCFWSAMMAKDPELQPTVIASITGDEITRIRTYVNPAWLVGCLHDKAGEKEGQPQIEFAMDMHNNSVGIRIGKTLTSKASTLDVINACDQALNDGKLIWIKDGKLTKPATYFIAGETKPLDAAGIFLGVVTIIPGRHRVKTDLAGKITATGPIVYPRLK